MLKKVKKTTLLIILGFSLYGGTGPLQAGGSDGDQTITYVCDDGSEIQVRYLNSDGQSSAILTRNGNSRTLDQIRAASGSKYGDASLTWWEKGGSSLLIDTQASIRQECRTEP